MIVVPPTAAECPKCNLRDKGIVLAKRATNAYLDVMFDFCLPTRSTIVPDGPHWLHEVKYDGFRLRLGTRRRPRAPITRGGYDWTKRYPWIT
jgi:ATP-dependent DNA ligase